MSEIFICPKGSISDRSVRTLREAGVIVVQADDPNACRFIRGGEEMSASDLLWAALKAVKFSPKSADYGSAMRHEFAQSLFELVDASLNRRHEPATTAGAVARPDGASTE